MFYVTIWRNNSEANLYHWTKCAWWQSAYFLFLTSSQQGAHGNFLLRWDQWIWMLARKKNNDTAVHNVGFIPRLTHWGRDNMAAISQMTLSNAFSWMKILEFGLKFHWSLFPRVQLTIPALVQIMAWRRPGDKPLSEPMTISLLMHICVTRPQWVNMNWRFSQVYLSLV